MEPLEVIDLSSDDENSPPRRTVHDEKKKASTRNNEESVKIWANVVKKRHITIDHVNNGSCPSKKIKISTKEDNKNILTNLLHKKPEITLRKINIKRIKPETISTPSTPKSSGSEPVTESRVKNNLKTCDNVVKLFDNDSTPEKTTKSSNSKDDSYMFKINEGASSSTETKTPQLTVKSKVKVSEMVDNATTPSAEAFESFLEACRSQEPGREIEIIISKFRKRYKNLEPFYAKSGSFIQLLRLKRNLILTNKAKLYLHISEVMDEMKARQNKNRAALREKKKSCRQPVADFSANQNLSNIPEEDADDEKNSDSLDSRNEEKLQFLDKAMRKCERYILKCEEAEVDFDDENDSNYILAEKYKERMVQLYNKYCEITGQIADAARPYLRPKNLDVTPLPTLNNAITSFINMKIKTMNKLLVNRSKKNRPHNFTDALIFPDYADILKCVKKCNAEENLQLNRNKLSDIAKNAFSELGKHLQRYRHMDYYDTFSLYLEKGDHDPASDDESLAQKLRENHELGKKKLDQVFQEYVEKQNAAKEIAKGSRLEEEEEGPKTADESSNSSDGEDSDADEDKTISDSDADEDKTICGSDVDEDKETRSSDADEDKKICGSDDIEFGDLDSKLPNDAEPESINEVEPPDNQADDKEEIEEDEVSNEEHHKDHKPLAIKKHIRKSIEKDTSRPRVKQSVDTKQIIEMETSESSTGEVKDDLRRKRDPGTSEISVDNIEDDVSTDIDMDTSEPSGENNLNNGKITNEKDAEMILLQSSTQQTERKGVAIKVLGSDQKMSETASPGSPEVIALPQSSIQEPTSTVATCKVNVVERSQTSKMNPMDNCSSVIAAEDIEVMDAPVVDISSNAVNKDEETQPKLRLRPFAKPPGSWEDFQPPPKSSTPEIQATGMADDDTEKRKVNKPTEREQTRFIKINKPTQVGKVVQVTKDVFINLTNKPSTVLIPPNSNKSNPEINVKTVTNNVTLNFNNVPQFQTKVTSIAPKNLIKINDSGKIITRYANVGVINATSNKDKVPAGCVATPTIKYKNQMIPIRNSTNQVRLAGPQTTGISKVPRSTASNTIRRETSVPQVPVVDRNGTEKLYLIVKRPLGANPQNIILPAATTGLQNQTPRNPNRKSNSNLVSVTVPNVKLQISNGIRHTLPSKVPRQSLKRDDKVYETSTDGVPTYLIE